MEEKPNQSQLSSSLQSIRLPFLSNSPNKYRLLLCLVSGLVLLTLLMLALNIIATNQILAHTKIANAAARQNILAQQISKQLFDLSLHLPPMPPATPDQTQDQPDSVPVASLPDASKKLISNIQQHSQQFEHHLKAFEQGGSILSQEGIQINIPALADPSPARESVSQIRQHWHTYHRLINQLTAEIQAGNIKIPTLNEAIAYARKHDQAILQNGQQLNFSLTNEINQKANFWRTLQFLGIVLAVVLFAAVLFIAIRKLINADAELQNANAEFNQIMSTIPEGLFLLEKDFTIGQQHSAPLESILGQTNIQGQNFLDILAPMLPESELIDTQMFIEQLYSPWVHEELVEDLNPLHRILVSIDKENPETFRYLDFKFSRVCQDDRVQRILVSVIDSTESVALESSMQAQQEEEERTTEILDAVSNIDIQVLNNFIQTSLERLQEINDILRKPENSHQELKAKSSFIGRTIHILKGESGAMNLSRMVDICSTFEDTLAKLRQKSSLRGDDFLGVTWLLEDLFKLLDILSSYTNSISENTQPENNKTNLTNLEINHLQSFAYDIAKRNNKKVSLLVQGFDDYHIEPSQRQSLQLVLTQLLRNAIVHGIEYPSVRRNRNKSEAGSVKFILSGSDDGNLTLIAEDDGNGIDFEAIRSKAVAEGRYTVEEVGQLSKKQLLSLMLNDGFSTATQNTEDAGKGLGMGAIRQTLQKMGGKFNINTAYEQYTRFTISFPPQQPLK